MSDVDDGVIVRRSLDTDADEPGTQIAAAVAELEDRDPTDLDDMWSCTDDVLENLFSTPPAPDARMRVAFSYEGYRVTVDQDGTVEFVPLSAT